MEKNYDTKSIAEVFMIIKELVYSRPYEEKFSVYVEIITTDGLSNKIKIANDKQNQIKINSNIIMYNKTAISLHDIVKIKILTNSIEDNTFKNIFIKELKNITIYNYKKAYNSNSSYQKRYNNRFKNKDIQSYIENNCKEIKSINHDGIKFDNYSKKIINVDVEDVLNNKTSLDIKKKNVLDNVDINLEECNVINSIEKSTVNVIKGFDIEEKLVLTNNSKEVEVAKPVKIKEVEVITNLDTKEYNVVIDQGPTTAIKEITENKSEAIIGVIPSYLKGVIGNIDKEKQIIKPKTIDILGLEPINKYVDKNEVNGKPLQLDPTGERYIGVVLEDGAFEPLKIELKTVTVLQDGTINLLGNINKDSQIKQVVESIDELKADLLKSLNIEYTQNVAEYKEENLKQIKGIINTSSDIVNSITNKNDTAHVVTKDETELMRNIQKIHYNSIQKIDDIKTVSVIKSARLVSTQNSVIEDVKLNKEDTKVVKDIDTIDEKVPSIAKENIDGNVETVGDGIMVVNNDNLDITIYCTSKISSVN